jgi:hypothetical protein
MPEVMNLLDVLVVERSERLSFAAECREAIGVIRESVGRV